MENNMNIKEFQELLRKGIGSRSQTEFAKVSGISRGNLNRMLNGEDISKPSIGILKKMASHMSSVSLNELLASCGYAPLDIKDHVEKNMVLLKEGLTNCFLSVDMTTVDDVCNTLKLLYLEDDSEFIVVESGKNPVTSYPLKVAEEYAIIEQRWKTDGYFCTTYFAVFYVKTQFDNLIVLNHIADYQSMLESGIINDKIKKVFESDSFDKENLTHLREVKKISEENKKTATFLKHLFSADGTYTETIHGCGFYYDKTPELFMQFFLSNSAIFCMEKQNREIFQKAVAYGNSTNVDEIFEEFTDVNGETGTGAVLAYIMRALSGKQFFYYPSNEESMGCILCEYTNEKSSHERIPDDMLYETYKVAKELEIPEIGMVYFTYLLNKYTDQVYKTDSIYYNFKEN